MLEYAIKHQQRANYFGMNTFDQNYVSLKIPCKNVLKLTNYNFCASVVPGNSDIRPVLESASLPYSREKHSNTGN